MLDREVHVFENQKQGLDLPFSTAFQKSYKEKSIIDEAKGQVLHGSSLSSS